MVEEAKMKIIKYLLFVFNLIFFICGLALLVVGIVVKLAFKEYTHFFTRSTLGPWIFVIIIGVIIFIFGFIGCCGAIKENYCLLASFGGMLVVIFVLEFSGVIASVVLKNDINDLLYSGMKDTMKNYDYSSYTGLTKLWDLVEEKQRCCGTHNLTDWKINKQLSVSDSVPDSCCKKQFKNCGFSQINLLNNTYSLGCFSTLEKSLKSNASAVIGIGVTVALFQICGMVLAFLMARGVKARYEIM